MYDPAQLQALVAVLRDGSFEAAAMRLGVTPSAVSQRIRALEERIGTALVQRGPPAQPTATGERVAAHAETLALLDTRLRTDLGLATEATGTVRLAINADSLATWFLPALAAAEGHLYDIEIDDQDHSADWLRRGAVMAAVTAHAAPVPGCTAFALGALPYRAVASPAFVDRWFAGGLTPQALAEAPALVFNSKDRLQARWAEAVLGRSVALSTHRLGSTHAFTDATLLGIGWGLNPATLVDPLIAQGRLVALDDGRALAVPLVWQVARLVAPALAPLTAAVRTAARRALQPA